MALGFEPARGIDRELAVLGDHPLRDDARALPLRRQPHGFVFDQLGDGEAVMHLGEGEIGQRDAGSR